MEQKDFFINEKEHFVTWFYEYNMWKNLEVLFTIVKVFMICILAPVFVVFCCKIGDGFIEACVMSLKIYVIILGIIMALIIITYPIIVLIKGGKYIVLFEMDELGISHKEMDKEFKKTQAFTAIGIIIGAVTKNSSVLGANILAGVHQSIYSNFKKVRKVIVKRKRNTIKLITSDMYNNQIYVDNENFEYVLNYILERCPKNVVRRGI